MLKKTLACVFALVVTLSSSYAQGLTLRAGTPVRLLATKTVYARDVEVGSEVSFKTAVDLVVGDKVILPAGSPVMGIVTEAKKSTIAGTKGRLKIKINSLPLPSGVSIFLDHEEAFYGTNRTPIAVIAALFVLPGILIPGSKAYMPEGYTTTALVVQNTPVE